MWLVAWRVRRGWTLLRSRLGCTSLGSFSARFTELVGETPTAYRASDHSALARVPGCIAKDLTRPTGKPASKASTIGEALAALAP